MLLLNDNYVVIIEQLKIVGIPGSNIRNGLKKKFEFTQQFYKTPSLLNNATCLTNETTLKNDGSFEIMFLL